MTADLREHLQRTLGSAYSIEHELGGGMSRVFAAEERALGRKVVLKVLPSELSGAVSAERFRREIQLAARLQHPHIVPLLRAGEAEGLLYYTMPFVEGEALQARLARDGELPVADAVRVLRDLADALAYAHRHGVVHRDVKPANVLLSGGHALVTDWRSRWCIRPRTNRSMIPLPVTPFWHCHTSIDTNGPRGRYLDREPARKFACGGWSRGRGGPAPGRGGR